jgi:hypothetical protein
LGTLENKSEIRGKFGNVVLENEISWSDHVRNEDVLQTVKEERETPLQ